MEAFGIAGKEFLKSTLASCTDPAKAIRDFQNENGIQLQSLDCALPLLDLHNVRKLEFHQQVLESLKDMLMKRIEDMSKMSDSVKKHKLEKLLETAFPGIYVPPLRPVVMHLMKHIPNLNPEYLEKIRKNPELYKECDVAIKRQIWYMKQSLFGEEVSPILTQYIKDKEHLLFSHDTGIANSFFMLSPVQRRNTSIIQQLVNMIGENLHLYEIVLHFIRTLFIRNRNVHYCTLRTELLMAFHDANNKTICGADPCHSFAWCLDACMREKVIDDKRKRELTGLLDSIGRGSNELLGDLSISLCDPYVINFFSLYTVRILQHCVHQEALPRQNDLLLLLLRMLNLGLGAWDMIDRQEFREPSLDSALVCRFLPGVMYMMVDESQQKLVQQAAAGSGEGATALGLPTISTTVPGVYMEYIMESNIAGQLGLYYTLHAVRHKDKGNLMRIVPTLMSCDNDRALDDTFLHAFVTLLIPMGEEFASEDFCDVIFDKFLLMSVSRENVVRHILRLLWFTQHRMPADKLNSLMSIIDKISSNEAIQDVYEKLQDKISSTISATGVSGQSGAAGGGAPEGDLIHMPVTPVTPTPPGHTPGQSHPLAAAAAAHPAVPSGTSGTGSASGQPAGGGVPATPYPHGGLF